MAVDGALAGRTFPAPAPYAVSDERVAEFAAATGSRYDGPGTPAPTTFPIVVAFKAMDALLEDPTVGIALHRVVHGEQRFRYSRPVVAGDVLTAMLTVDSLRQIAGSDIIGTSTEIVDASGAHVVTATMTLVHRGES
ncbi:FAS1-like dehydratase domain-containing protein [Nocardioides caldifontis]|uniref:FAS1-like dehydratase domain-containing protein n=1 Tax=Nocardioides caldifontis TaxID=2588938 RepID=UPI0011E02513|nr:MaoC family dehydratase N-terminal domain-containing protein [Nocardioides caldifontis]